MTDCNRTRRSTLVLVAAAVCFVIAEAALVLAQGSRSTPLERRLERMTRQREEFERETLGNGAETASPRREADRRRAQAVTAQVKQDFDGIQVVYNRIVLAMANTRTLDYHFVADATAELRKRASRLKSNLALPKHEDSEKAPKKPNDGDVEQIRASLMTLRGHVVSFVTNPLFESADVLDVELSTKASRDLGKIIEISDSISRGVHKVMKPAG